MIKGVNHTIIEVKDSGNRYFERALLFVRPSLETVSPQHLQNQANRFIDLVGTPPKPRPNKKQKQKQKKQVVRALVFGGFWFVLGIVCGLLTGFIF